MPTSAARLAAPTPVALALAAVTALFVGCAHARTGQTVAAPDERGWVVVPNMKIVAQVGEADCGPAAMTMTLARWGATPSPDAWQPRTGENREHDGFSAGALRDEARRAGFQSYVFAGTFADLVAEVGAGRPVIVGLVRVEHDTRASHFAVVVGHDATAGRWLLADPAAGLRTISRDDLEAQWASAGWVTLVLTPTAAARQPRPSL